MDQQQFELMLAMRMAFEMEQWEKVLAISGELLAESEDQRMRSILLLFRANAFRSLGRDDESEQTFEEILANLDAPVMERARAVADYGLFRMAREEYELAAGLFDRIEEMTDDEDLRSQGFKFGAEAYALMGDEGAALLRMRKLVELPGAPAGWVSFGLAYIAQMDPDLSPSERVEWLERSLAAGGLEPDEMAGLLRTMVRAYDWVGRIREAIDANLRYMEFVGDPVEVDNAREMNELLNAHLQAEATVREMRAAGHGWEERVGQQAQILDDGGRLLEAAGLYRALAAESVGDGAIRAAARFKLVLVLDRLDFTDEMMATLELLTEDEGAPSQVRAEAGYELARQYLYAGVNDSGLRYAQAALELPDIAPHIHGMLLNQLAVCALMDYDLDEAARYNSEAEGYLGADEQIQLTWNHIDKQKEDAIVADGYFNSGLLSLEKRNKFDAVLAFEKAIKIGLPPAKRAKAQAEIDAWNATSGR